MERPTLTVSITLPDTVLVVIMKLFVVAIVFGFKIPFIVRRIERPSDTAKGPIPGCGTVKTRPVERYFILPQTIPKIQFHFV